MPENDVGDLTAEEERYFETRGEQPVESVEAVETVETVEPVGKEPEKQSFVPVAALHEERRERQALAASLAERERSLATLESRLNTLQEVWGPKPPAPPSYDDDPIGAINHKLEQNTRAYEELKRAEQGRTAAEIAKQQTEQLRSYGKAQAEEFKEKQPDFYDAYNSIWANKDAELRAIGIEDPATRHRFIAEYEASIIQSAASQGANVAERMYTLAKSLGYTPKQAEMAVLEKKLDTIAAGQSASKSIGSGGGSAPPAKMSLAALASMSDAEFEAYTSDSDKWRRINTGG